MPGTHPPCAPEYPRRIIELARAGRSVDVRHAFSVSTFWTDWSDKGRR